MSRGRAPKSVGAVKNEKKTTLPTQVPRASRCAVRRSAVTRRSRLLAVGELVRRSFHRRAGRRTPESQLLDLLRQREVPFGDPARRVRLQLDPDLPPGDLQVGMVVGRLAEE